MTHIGAIILGFVEGATEFIPVSSSGHLIIARKILGTDLINSLTFDAILQLSASLAILVYFWRDILELVLTARNFIYKKPIEEKQQTLLFAIFLGTIPAIIFGLFLEKSMDTVFRNINLVALTLILGSVLFWYADKKSKQFFEEGKNKTLSVGRGIVIGFFQCLALVPGVSRSGATISGGFLSGLPRDEAVRFSFLLSVPILFGAGLKKLFEIRHNLFSTDFGSELLVGSLTAFIVGLFAINFLITYLKNHNLKVFIWYRIILAIVLIIIF